jgi:hypothetical protein
MAIAPSEFAFVEYYQTQEGVAVQGDVPQGRRIDGPTYRYDRQTRTLEVNREIGTPLDSISVLVGIGKILKGAAGAGVSSFLRGTGHLPFTFDKLTIRGIDAKGLHVTHDGRDAVVAEGGEWKDIRVSTDTLPHSDNAIVRFTTTYSIRYHGLIGRQALRQGNR